MKRKNQVYKVLICLFIGLWLSQLAVQAQEYPQDCGAGMGMKVDGNVGIGLTSPIDRLHVYTNDTYRGITLESNTYHGGSGGAQGAVLGELNFKNTGNPYYAKIKGEIGSSGWAAATALSFWTNAGNAVNHRRMTIDYNGHVGIGTATPSAKLVSVSGTNSWPATAGNSASGVGLRVAGADNAVIDFGTNGGAGTWIQARNQAGYGTNYNLVINPNGGYVGIGTATPDNNLAVSTTDDDGGITIEGSKDANLNLKSANGVNHFPSVAFYQDNDLKGYIQIDDNTSDDFRFVSNVNGDISFLNGSLHEKMVINTNTGNIGIGHPTPNDKIHAYTSATYKGITLESNTYHGGSGGAQGAVLGELNFKNTGNPYYAKIKGEIGSSGWAAATALSFWTNAGNAISHRRMTIDYTGNVGIGTATPNAKLVSVSGTNAWPATAGNSASGVGLRVAGADNAVIDFGANGGAGTWIQARNQAGYGTNYKLAINPNGGYVGIGTTNPSAKLEVAGDIKSSASVTAAEFKVGNWVISEKQPPDYVFEKDYDLKPLDEVAKYVSEKKHLPEVPSAAQMEKEGIDLVDMNLTLLKKVEELTLYLIKQHKEIEVHKREIEELKRKIGD